MNQFKANILPALCMVILLSITAPIYAQKDKSNRPSPPRQVSEKVDGVKVTIDYSSPGVKGRTIFGGLESFDKVWRAGANEATWIEVSDTVMVNGEKLPEGKYSFFIIPRDGSDWTIIFNSTWDQWGAYNYDEEMDVLRVDVTPEEINHTERLEYTIDKDGTIAMNWSTVSVPFSISKK